MRSWHGQVATAIALAACGAGPLPACNTASAELCSPGSEGFSEGVQFQLRTILDVQRAEGAACNARVEAIRDDAALAKLYADLKDLTTLGPPAIDFARESVIVREDTDQAPTRWIAAIAAVATVGGQGCVDVPATKCAIQLYVVPAKIDRAELRTCQPTVCTGAVPLN